MLASAHVEQRVQAFLRARGGVDEAVVDGDRARQDLEQRHLADELVGDGLEHVAERLGRRVRRHLDLHRRRSRAGRDLRRPVGRGGAELADEVGQPVDADPRRRRADEYRELGALEHLVGEGALELGRRGHLARQVALELLVVAGDDLLDQLVVQAVLLVGDVGGDGFGVVLAVRFVLESLVGQHVGDTVELLLLAERELEGHETGPELRLQVVDHRAEVGARLVLLVDEDEPRDTAFGALAPGQFGADLHAVDRADHQHRQVGNRQGGVDVAGEVGVTRGIDEVDLVVLPVRGLPLERGQRERQGHRTFGLFGLGVTHRRPVLDPPGPREHAGPEEQRLSQRRLAAPAVADDGDIADLVGRRVVQA